MPRTALALITAAIALCSCSTSRPLSPAPATAEPAPRASPTTLFPLVTGARYTFHAVFRGRSLDWTTVVRHAPVAGKIYYFVKEEDERGAEVFIASANIGGGLYASRADGVYVGPVGFLSRAPSVRPASMQLMVALPPKVNAPVVVEIDPRERWSCEYVVDAIETVSVPAGTFPGSARITFTTTMNTVTERARAWLAPGVGLVRWERATGRIDELVSYEIPR